MYMGKFQLGQVEYCRKVKTDQHVLPLERFVNKTEEVELDRVEQDLVTPGKASLYWLSSEVWDSLLYLYPTPSYTYTLSLVLRCNF